MKRIKKNNIKFSLFIVFMSLLLLIGIVAIINPTKYTSFFYRNGIIVFMVGVMGIIISSFFIYELGIKLFNRNAIFLINSKGIIDKVNILDYPFICWTDVITIEECKVNNTSYLKVIINNPERYINQKKGLKKWLLNLNYKKYHTPILLNNTFLKCSFIELKQSITEAYEEYKKNK
ncbi:STM3941 family protein [Kaistella sp.]|uniref:STM3941 family protein n=1 Tax=Kaistella sp. TaxID=2782235 RepID=UPI003C3EA9AB